MMKYEENIASLVGNTPLIKLRQVSEETGCNILGKAEFLNPGQSVKDRAALWIIRDAEKKGLLEEGGLIVEGTAGNTGIGLTIIGQALGYRTLIVMPETQSKEKIAVLRDLGAELKLVPAVPYSNPNNYIKYSKKITKRKMFKKGDIIFWKGHVAICINSKELIHAYGPEKKVLVMSIRKTIDRIKKTTNLTVKKISSNKY